MTCQTVQLMKTLPELVTGFRAWCVRKRIHFFIFRQALGYFGDPVKAYRELKRLRKLRGKAHGSAYIPKYVRSGSRWYWNTDYCGFPSDNLKEMIRGEFERNSNHPGFSREGLPLLQTVIWAITNRCPMSCSHCYEWDNIDKSDHLGLDELKQILGVLKGCGLRHLQFSGGEPLDRFDDLVSLVQEASPFMDCWLLTSGFGLTYGRAAALHRAGLTGVQISLDHWNETEHNAFRNNTKSFHVAIEAVKNCIENKILVSLSLCATREFVTWENLMKYAEIAKELGASFIRILEPRATGRFSNAPVRLEQEQVMLLSEFAVALNNKAAYREYPVVAFFGYHQRILGCFGAGNRYLYIDPNGDVHPCPFCRGKQGNMLENPFGEIVEKIRKTGCLEFEGAFKG